MKEAPDPALSVVVPAWNEAKRLPGTLDRLVSRLEQRDGQAWEILVVSDGSDDGTEGVVTSRDDGRIHLLRHDARQGKGAAVRTGVLAARGRRILFTDADLATPIEDLEALEASLAAGADVAIGSRRLPDSEITHDQGRLRRSMGRFFPHLMRLASGLDYADTQCGFKLFTAPAAKRLFAPLEERGFAFDVEILCRAREEEFEVTEAPVHWESRDGSKVSSVRDPLRMLGTLLRLGSRTDLPRVVDQQLRVAAGLGLGIVLVPLLLVLALSPGMTFPPLLAACVLLGAVFLAGREVEDATVGLLAAFAACTTLLFLGSLYPPTSVLFAALAVHGVVVALLLTKRRPLWGGMLFFLLGSALVTGGLHAFALALVPAVLLVWQRPEDRLFSALPVLGGTALFLAVVYLGVQRSGDPEAMLMGIRCAEAQAAGAPSLDLPTWLLLPAGWFPWILLLLHPGLWRTRPERDGWRLAFLAWGVLPAVVALFLGLTHVPCLLPGLGGLAVLLAAALTTGIRTGRVRSAPAMLVVFALGVVLVLGSALLFF